MIRVGLLKCLFLPGTVTRQLRVLGHVLGYQRSTNTLGGVYQRDDVHKCKEKESCPAFRQHYPAATQAYLLHLGKTSVKRAWCLAVTMKAK